MSPVTDHIEDIFNEHVYGDVTFTTLAQRFGVSTQRIQEVFRAYARQHVDMLEMNLLVARKEGNFLGLLIPPAVEAEQNAAINYLHWVLKQLAKRGVSTETHYRPAYDGGIAFFLEDVTKYLEGGSTT